MIDLYACIATNLPKDKGIRRAGALAELLYIRCILLSKEILSDGAIDDGQLDIAAVGIPGDARDLAAKLVKERLWERTDDGWRVPPEKWAKWQTTADEVKSAKKSKSEAGRIGAKARWSKEKTKESSMAPMADGCDANGTCHSDRNATAMRPQCTETETETTGEEKGESLLAACGPPAEAASDPPAPPPANAEKKKPLAPKPDGGVMEFPVVGTGPFRSWWLMESKVKQYRESYPGLDVMEEMRAARQWCIDNATNRKTPDGMFAFLARWLKQEQNRSRAGPSAPARKAPNSPARIRPEEGKYDSGNINIIDATPAEDRTPARQGA